MTFRFVLPVLAAMAAFAPAASEAQEFPWCVQYGGRDGGAINCGFFSFEQCMATARGTGGYCYQNPAYPERRSTQTRKRRTN